MSTYSIFPGRLASILLGVTLPLAAAFAAPPSVGPNVNMVQGTKWPEGDPFLTKQNEPSIAVSSRNPRHLLAGSNDYRLVPVEIAEELDDPEAWVQIYKSIDGGATWRSTPLGGCPINIPECNDSTGLTAPLKAKHPNFGADPTARAGPHGTFFLSFIAGTRDTSAAGVVAVQRFVDKNNDIQRSTDLRECTTPGTGGCATVRIPDGCTGGPPACTVKNVVIKSAEDPILPDVLNIIDVGTPGQGKDKPWIAVDVGRRSWNGANTCELLSWTKNRTDVANAAETVGAFNVYVSYANFTGNSNKPDIYVAVSSDCGKTFGKAIKISSGGAKNQGTSSGIDPSTGAVYIVWRGFYIPPSPGITSVPDQILMSKSTDGGKTWSKPMAVASAFNPYDQGSTGVSIRTLDFPSVAVSVAPNGQSRVHVAWSQRKVAPSSTPPSYACPSANPADCDARIVVATSTNGGTTFGIPKAVDDAYTVNVIQPNGSPTYSHSRGTQIQASLTFSAGKLLATWLDSREDHTQGVLVCPATNPGCTNVSDRVEVRRAAKNSNLDAACHIDVSQPPLSQLPATQKAALDHCYNPAAVWTTYMTDGSPGLVRRHTLDTYSAMADPADAPLFASSRVSRYTFGNTAQTAQGTYEIVQKEVSPQNLAMFSNGTGSFIGDYIDSAGQLIVATGDVAQPYKFNAGVTTNGPFVTGGFAPVFHVAFTDNRDVIPPLSGDWTTPACQTTDFTKDANGNITGVKVGTTCGPGYAGNRNQNVYTAAIAENSVAFAGANSKLLDSGTARSFVVTVRNLTDIGRWYALTLPAQPAGGRAAFKLSELPAGTVSPAFVFVQPKSSAARAVWAKATSGNAKVTVLVQSLTGAPTIPPSGPPTYTPDNAFTTQVFLNPDANAPLVKNGDGTGPLADTAIDNVGNVVLSNAVLTNNALSNNVLTNNVLSNNALTNAVLSNVVLSNVVLSNLDPANAVLSNDPLSNNALTNNALSNVVLSNVVLSNNALSNAVLSNVVLSNNALNAALTNLDPANVALSNAVLSNNALTNVVLTNLDPNNALSNAMLTNNALTNAVLSNVVLSNNALSNNALSNNVLSNVVLSNAPLGDGANGGDPEALSTIETGAVEIAKNSFQTGDLQNSNFKETTFTIRNRGNIDTVLAIKLMLRDAICTGAPNYTCTTPPGYKLQLVLRKVALVPVAIPPTGPAVSTGRSIRIGIAQANTEVSNVSDLPLIDPSDPNLGKFLPDDPSAAMLSLAAGEYAYATIRAIGVGGTTPPDPADLLQWGVKTVTSNANSTNGPLVIRTLNFPASPAFFTLNTATPTFRTFGGIAPITGAAVCADKFGNPVLNGVGAPASSLGALGNFYIDTTAQTLYGPKASSGWPAGTPLIGNGPSGPQASVPCPPGAITMGSFTTDATFNSAATVTFTPKYWGDFYMLANVADVGAPPQTDRQVIKVTVLPRIPALTYTGFPTTLTYNTGINLRPLVSSDSKSGASPPVLQPIVFSASGSCHMAADGDNLVIDRATVPIAGPADCIVSVHQDGNEIYAPITDTKPIFIDRASQTIVIDSIPASGGLTYNNNGLPAATLVAHATSTTAPFSGLSVTFTSLTPSMCTVTPAGVLTITGAGTCTITADQGGNANYKPAPTAAPAGFVINPANQVIAFGAAPANVTYGNTSVTVTATSSSPTAPPSGIAITFSSQTPLVCTASGASGVVSILAAGTCTIAANQAGNANYNPAPQVSQSFVVQKANQAITFGAAPAGVTFGDPPVPVSATSATVPPPSGTTAGPSGIAVVLTSQTPLVCTIAGTTVTIVAAGTCTIAADQGGNSNYNPAPTVTQTFAIAKAPVQFTVAPQTFVSFGSTPTVSGTLNRPLNPSVYPASGVTATLKKNGVIVVSPNNPYAPASGANGAFTVSDAGIVPEDYTLTFDYAGSANFLAATSLTTALRVEGFSNTPNMSSGRAGHSSTLLNDGNVLLAGGVFNGTGVPTATAEIYCAVVSPLCSVAEVGTFKPATSMTGPRAGQAATLLFDGTVLITGGLTDAVGTPTATSEVYCTAVSANCTAPQVGTFQPVAPMTTARAAHTATLLPDHTVLIAGGYDGTAGFPPSVSAEVYCTATSGVCGVPDVGAFKAVGDMGTARDSQTATLLNDGTVLVTGGESDSSGTPTATAELYCPIVIGSGCTAGNIGKFVPLPAMNQVRSVQTATLLQDGRVVVVGGYDSGFLPSQTAEVYCAVVAGNCAGADTGTFKVVGALTTQRANQTATLLTDGFTVAIGGLDATLAKLASSDLFDPLGNSFVPVTPSMAAARSGHAATRLQDGRVLVTGGRTTTGTVVNSAELFNGPF